jgi:hypothetical protein
MARSFVIAKRDGTRRMASIINTRQKDYVILVERKLKKLI